MAALINSKHIATLTHSRHRDVHRHQRQEDEKKQKKVFLNSERKRAKPVGLCGKITKKKASASETGHKMVRLGGSFCHWETSSFDLSQSVFFRFAMSSRRLSNCSSYRRHDNFVSALWPDFRFACGISIHFAAFFWENFVRQLFSLLITKARRCYRNMSKITSWWRNHTHSRHDKICEQSKV